MTQNRNASNSSNPPLDDVMMAMDVVDTLRHDQRIVEQELNDESRRAELIRRLKKIYREQGIEVSDDILKQGVQALEDERFTYTPPPDTLTTRLAKIYVTRMGWGRYAFGAVAGLIIIWMSWQLFYENPRRQEELARQTELSQGLPNTLQQRMKDITAEAKQPEITTTAREIGESGLRAAQAGNLQQARQAGQKLQNMLQTLRQEYTIRIINKPGQQSGIWRIPNVNQNARNYYLVVEAVDTNGNILDQSITNEETGQTELVKSWAVRVPHSEYNAVALDKQHDGIIQNAVVATKSRGYLDPQWRIKTSGGAITKW